MKVYIAAAFSRRDEMTVLADILIGDGHTITSRWIHGDEAMAPKGMVIGSPECHAWMAQADIDDLMDADVLLAVSGATTTTGGRHIEFGIAVQAGKRLLLLGEPENIFHHLPQVEHCGSIDDVRVILI